MIGGASLASVDQKLGDRVLAGAGEAGDRADAHALTEKVGGSPFAVDVSDCAARDDFPSFNGSVLNYMSIQTALQRAVQDRTLGFTPMQDSDRVERVLMLGTPLMDLLAGDAGGEPRKVRVKRLLANFQSFVRGDVIPICMTPREHDQVFLGRLEPISASVFDIRSRDAKPSLRVLGRFARPDVFVALDWWPRFKRVSWSTKEPLTDDRKWAAAIAAVQNKWNEILPGITPVIGDKVEGYVTRNYDTF